MLDGIGWVSVGTRSVGGSYLQILVSLLSLRLDASTDLTDMMKTWNFFTGIFSWNTSAKRSKPLPLLVVHSGKTTTGLEALRRISSSGSAAEVNQYGGAFPVCEIIDNRETCRNPVIGIREEVDLDGT